MWKFPKESEDAARRAGEPLVHLEHNVQCLTKAAATFEFLDGAQPKFNFCFLVIRFSHSAEYIQLDTGTPRIPW